MPKIFEAAQFTATQWSTAEEKAAWANKLAAFVLSGFHESKWTKPVYNRLMNTFGHIAHYNINGFWDEWFCTPQRCMSWVRHTLEANIYGDPTYTYCDVERAFQKWLQSATAQKALETVQERAIEGNRQIAINMATVGLGALSPDDRAAVIAQVEQRT
ncbi:MAG: hypothetical protein JSS66_05710 [Armatimonadetes bacterium]|nr:hypothetical protein [Armatimonadota bacterium]